MKISPHKLKDSTVFHSICENMFRLSVNSTLKWCHLLFSLYRKHASLCELNSKVVEAMQMYHNLMKDTPAPYGFKGQQPPPQVSYSFPSQVQPANYLNYV